MQGYGDPKRRQLRIHSEENTHNHPAEAGAMTAARIVNLVKEKALEDKFRPASAIVEEVCKLHLKNSQELAYVVRILLNFRIVS